MKEKLFRKMEEAKRYSDSFNGKCEFDTPYRMYWNGAYNTALDLAFELGYVDIDYYLKNRRDHLTK